MSEGNLGSYKEKSTEKVTFQHGSESHVLQDEKRTDEEVLKFVYSSKLHFNPSQAHPATSL